VRILEGHKRKTAEFLRGGGCFFSPKKGAQRFGGKGTQANAMPAVGTGRNCILRDKFSTTTTIGGLEDNVGDRDGGKPQDPRSLACTHNEEREI